MSYGPSAFPPVWKNIIGCDKPSLIRPYEKRMNADELALSLRETISRGLVLYLPFVRFISHRADTITKVFDRSPFGNHGTIHGAVWQTLPSGKSALSFDGVDDYVDIPNNILPSPNAFTICAWIYPKGENSDTEYDGQVIIDLRGQYLVFLVWNESDDPEHPASLRGWIHDGDTPYNLFSPNYSLPENNWHYVGMVWDGANQKIFYNGNIISQPANNPASIEGYESLIGKDYALNLNRLWFHGLINEVRIYNRALSEEEIKRLYELTRVFYGV